MNVSHDHNTESSSDVWARWQEAFFRVGSLIDIRLAIVISLIAFMVAVGFDSTGNQAEAADLVDRVGFPSVSLVSMVEPMQNEHHDTADAAPGLKLSPGSEEMKLTAARRLRHGTMTSAIMTSSRLTQAHFFTDIPSRRQIHEFP